MKLEERLIQLRTENDLSQDDLARMMRISRQTVSRWETGAAIPSVENAKYLSELYGISVDELLYGARMPLTVETIPENIAPDQGREKKKLVVLLAVVLAIGVIVGVIWWASTKSVTNTMDAPVNISELEESDIQCDQVFNFGNMTDQEGQK